MADQPRKSRATDEKRDDVIVTDTSPLITLALGEGLRALAAPQLRIVIPDAVWVEGPRLPLLRRTATGRTGRIG